MANTEIGVVSRDTADQVRHYYTQTESYLTGPLRGTCHFGFTPEGTVFELTRDLRLMERLLGNTLDLPPNSPVLDAGCGFCRVASTLANEFNLKVYGIDLTLIRFSEARRFIDKQKVSQPIRLIGGNYCRLPFADSVFTGAFTMETLCHADPLQNALREFFRVLRPGGKAVFFEYRVPEESSLDPIRLRITREMIARTGMTAIKYFTQGNLEANLHSVGFKNITTTDISRNVWPTWHWLFWQAIRNDWQTILQGKIVEYPNLAGSLLIWPYRHFLGYNITTATKPC